MAMSTSSGTGDYALFDELAEEFAERFRRGERPSLQEYVDRCPAMADEIRELFPALVEVEQAEEVLEGPDGRVAPPPTPMRHQVGDYRVIREVGRGGMGVVYEAEQVSLGRRVALKILPGAVARDRKALERFRREARAAARLHHTNIVPVFEVGQDGETVFYAMQFIQGQGLDAVIAELTRQRRKSGQASAAPIVAGAGDPAPEALGTTRPESAGTLSRRLAARPARDRTEALAAYFQARQVSRMARSLVTGTFAAEKLAPDGTGPADGLSATSPSASQPGDPTSGSSPGSSSTSAVLPGGTQVSAVESSGERLPFFRSAAQIGRQAAQGLSYAHARGILHRDIKPSNLLLDSAGVVWIADFGLAKADDGLTATGDILGTIRYMAPERFRGEGDLRADVYALGLTLYELLTLRPAFETSDRLQMIERIKVEEPVRPRLVDRRIPRDLETIVLKAIDKAPERRYAMADAMAEDLRRYLDGEPVLARRTTAPERYARWARRNPGIAALGAALTAVLLLVTAGSLLAVRRFARLARSEQAALLLVESEQAEVVASLRKAEAAGDEARAAEKLARDAERQARDAERQARDAEEAGRKLLYTTDMRLAPFLWRDDRTTAEQLRVLLARHIPEGRAAAGTDRGTAPRTPDLRGFEWYYYQHLADHSATVFSGHASPVVDGAFTADGHLVTLDQDGQLRRWDLNSQVEDEASRRDLPDGGAAQVRVLSPDGRRAAMAFGNRVHVLDAATGRETFQIPSANVRARKIIFSRDGERLVVVDDKIRWCNAASGDVIASLDRKFDRIQSLALSADGQTLAVVGHGGAHSLISVFRAAAGAKSAAPLVQDLDFGGTLLATSMRPDGRRLAVGGFYSGVLLLVDTAGGRPVAVHSSAHASPIAAMAFSGDGTKLATADGEGTIKIWADPEKPTSKSAAILTLKGHRGAIHRVGFSTDGKRLITNGADRTIRVWDLDHAAAAIRPLEESPASWVVRFSPDGQLIAAADRNGLHLWDGATGRKVRTLSSGDNGVIEGVAFSPTDHRLLAAGYGGGADGSHVTLWDIDAGTELARLPGATDLPGFRLHAYNSVVGTLAFLPDGKYLAAGFGSRRYFASQAGSLPVKVWEVATRRLIGRLDGHTSNCVSLDFSRDGRRLASGSRDGTAILWSTESWRATHKLHNPDQDMVEGVAFSPDGTILAMGSKKANVHLWEVAAGKLLETLSGHSNMVQAVAFSPDGRTLATGAADQTVRLWNVNTRRELMQLDNGGIERGDTTSLAFSPDGRQLLAGGQRDAFWSTAPIVWDDPDRAAEELRALLRSGADFRSRVRMLSENLRLHEALARLDSRDPRVRAALAAAQANWHASRKAWPEAVAACDRLLAADPSGAEDWLRTPGLLRLATALLHRDRPVLAARLLRGGARRRERDGLPAAVIKVSCGLADTVEGGVVQVTELPAGSPASRAGLVLGDIVLKVNDTEVNAETISRVDDLLAGDAGTRVRLTVRRAGGERPEVIEVTREQFLNDPATGDLLHPLRAAVDERVAAAPRDAGLLELRAELAGQWSDAGAQVADYTAAIDLLSQQKAAAPAADLARLYGRRGMAFVRLEKWQAAVDDFARAVTDRTTDDVLLTNQALALAHPLRPRESSVRLGRSNEPNGLDLVDHPDGVTGPAEVEGQPCRSVRSNPGEQRYAYFVIAKDFKWAPSMDVQVEVEYLAESRGTLDIEYDTPESAYKPSVKKVSLTGSSRWGRARFELRGGTVCQLPERRGGFPSPGRDLGSVLSPTCQPGAAHPRSRVGRPLGPTGRRPSVPGRMGSDRQARRQAAAGRRTDRGPVRGRRGLAARGRAVWQGDRRSGEGCRPARETRPRPRGAEELGRRRGRLGAGRGRGPGGRETARRVREAACGRRRTLAGEGPARKGAIPL